ncbi:MAG: TlpA disulfide reductase family protein [Thermodesulfobacteriota bacterium]
MKRVSVDGSEGPETGRNEMSRPSLLSRAKVRQRPGRIEKRWSLGWVLVAFLLLQCSQPVQVGQEAPDFVLKDLKGGSVSLGELRGKVVFLHFWATWCPPCLVELPGLQRFVEGLDKGQYALLAVCVDNERPARIGDFLKSWGTEIPVYLDPGGSLARRFGTVRFPETYILDRKGRVCRKVIGAGDWTTSKWAHILHTCAGGADTDKRELDAAS